MGLQLRTSELKRTLPESDLPARIENQISTWFSQDALGWRKVETDIRMAFQPAIILRLMGIKVVEDDMDLTARICGDETGS